MKTTSLYHGHRFPAVIISQAVRWYFRFQLSLRDIEELQAFLSSFGPIRQHFALKRHLLRASLYRKHVATRFTAWCEFTEVAKNPSAA